MGSMFKRLPGLAAAMFALVAASTAAQTPGTPLIGPAYAGNGQVFVSFSAPASTGGSPTGAYTATCTPNMGASATGMSVTSPIAVTGMLNNTAYNCSVTATNAAGIGPASATVSVTPFLTAPLTLIGVTSRKAHGSSGVFDIPINSATPLDGLVTTEPRVIGAGHSIVFQFNATINSVGPVTAIDESAAAVSAAATQAGNEVVVSLTGVANNKRVNVLLPTVNGTTVNASASVGLLVGDVNNSRTINASDISSIKARSGQTTGANFRSDVNTTGTINSSGISNTKSRSGMTLTGVSNPPPVVVAKVAITQTGLILTQTGATRQLGANATDAQGNVLSVPITWTSSKPAVMTVTGAGIVTAAVNNGTSQIVAQAGGVTSAPLLVVVTQPAAGAVLLTDAQIIGEPVETTPGDIPSFSNTYRVNLTGVSAPAIGAILINTESRIVAGRVVAVDSTANPIIVTLALVPMRALFPTLVITETIDLANAPIMIPADIAAAYNFTRSGNTFAFTPKVNTVQASAAKATAQANTALSANAAVPPSIGKQQSGATGTRALPPFTACETSITGGGGVGAPLPIALSAPPLFSVTASPKLDVKFDLLTVTGVERLVLDAEPVIKFEGGINIAVAFQGKIECKAELFAYVVPVGGPLALIIGGVVPMGVGIEAGGKLTVATMGIGTKVEVKAKVKAGISCPGGNLPCSFERAMDNLSATVTPTLDTPSVGDIRLEPSLSAFGYMEASIGNVFLKSLRFDFVKIKAGAKLAGSFALKESQLADPAYSSDYKLSLEASAEVGAKLDSVLALLGLTSVNALKLVISTDIAKSPAGLASGAVTADKASFVSGDTVNFTVKLDPATVDFFPGLGPYNVKKIQLVRKVGGTVSVVGSVDAIPGDSTFSFVFTATDSGTVGQFSAFVVTTLLPLDLLALEIGQAASSNIITSLAGNYRNTCAVVNGGVQCWGVGNLGQLGIPITEVASLIPVQTIAENSNVTAVGVGYYHACAVVNGGVKCWGANGFGQLGNGTAASTANQVQTLASGSGVTAIAVGENHSCAVVDGGVKCWGENFYGQLGNGQFNTVAPFYVASPVQAIAPGSNATAVSATSANTCAVVDGGVKCWGDNQYGQLGDGSTTNRAVPIQVIAAGSNATAVAVSFYFTCAIVDGGVRCWGHNIDGQFGTGSKSAGTSGATLPVQTIAPGSNVAAVAVGGTHSCILVSGGVKCAGANFYGFLGSGNTSPSLNFVQTIAPGTNVTVLGTGHYHTCAAANGGTKCWGFNDFGQLGNGTMVNSLVPVDVLPVAP